MVTKLFKIHYSSLVTPPIRVAKKEAAFIHAGGGRSGKDKINGSRSGSVSGQKKIDGSGS